MPGDVAGSVSLGIITVEIVQAVSLIDDVTQSSSFWIIARESYNGISCLHSIDYESWFMAFFVGNSKLFRHLF
jgi:hypothetical protein